MKTPFRIGDKVYLRPLERDDAPTLQRWFNDPRVTRTIERGTRPFTLAQEQAFLEALPDGDVVLGIALVADDRLVGTTGLHGIDGVNRSARFGIVVGETSEWGKGYATEATRLMVTYAFDTLNAHRVSLCVYDHNTRAIGIYERLGFVREGVLRQARFLEGKWHDVVEMAVLEGEWRR